MAQQFTQGQALLVAVGGAQSQTVGDATALARLLGDPARCAYPQQQVQLLSGAQATRPNLLRCLDALAATAAPDSCVFLYLGCADPTQAELLWDELQAKLAAIPAQRLLLLLDGYPFDSLAMPQSGGRVVIAATQTAAALHAGKPHSYFAQAVLEALSGIQAVQKPAAQKDGYVRVGDLANYVRQQLVLWTLGQQDAVLSMAEADNFVVAFYAGGDIEPIGLPTSQQAASLSLENLPAASLPPPGKTQSSSEKGVSLGGDLQESAVVTGDHNRLDQSSRVFDQRGGTVGRDQTNVAGNQNIAQQNITYIVQGGEGWVVPSAQPRAIEKPTPELISESIRLDVATPQRVTVDEPFDIAIAIRQPDAPLLEIDDLESVISGEGDVFRREENEIVRYRVEVSAAGCEVQPNKFTFYLKAGENSHPRFVQVTPRRAGRISILVNAYQEENDALAAQTRIKLEALIHATG